MSRTVLAGLAVTLLLAACKIERTPPELLNRRDPAAREREHAAGELRSRLAVLGQAFEAGELEQGVEALAPAEQVQVIGPGEPPQTVSGSMLPETLRNLVPSGTTPAQMEEVSVTLGPGAEVAWFAAVVRRSSVTDSVPPPAPWRVTGVLVLEEGAWRLVQAHISEAVPVRNEEPSPEAPAGPADE